MFATHGTPKIVKSDIEPPFNAIDLNSFLQEMGSKHHQIKPENPRENEEAESFLKVLYKIEQIALEEMS